MEEDERIECWGGAKTEREYNNAGCEHHSGTVTEPGGRTRRRCLTGVDSSSLMAFSGRHPEAGAQYTTRRQRPRVWRRYVDRRPGSRNSCSCSPWIGKEQIYTYIQYR